MKTNIARPRASMTFNPMGSPAQVDGLVYRDYGESLEKPDVLHHFGRIPLHAPNASPGMLQAKLKIGQAGDRYEQEADRMADHVMRMPDPMVSGIAGDEEELLQAKPVGKQITPIIQRIYEPPEEEEEEELIQAKAVGPGAVDISPDIASNINSLKGGGQPISQTERNFFEPRFGYDFSHVRVHTNDRAAETANSLNSKAFTVGNDIYFNQGKYNHENSSGKHLLAHELTHVLQQSNGAKIQKEQMPANPSTIINADNAPDIRAFINEVIEFLNTSAEFFPMSTVNQAMVDRVMAGYSNMAIIYPEIIKTRINNDAALMQSFKNALNGAVRSLFTRAAISIPNTTIVQLYLLNLHLLPDWGRPDVAGFNLADETQRRNFITNLKNAFSIATLFQNYPISKDIASLQALLKYLFTFVTDSQNLIANQLNNDAALTTALRNAYRTTIEQILTRASTTLGQTVLQLFLQFRYGSNSCIHEWADREIIGTTVAVPLGTTGTTGNITFSYNGFDITIEPDGVQTAQGAKTNIKYSFANQIAREWDGHGIITSLTPPANPAITIRTDYGPGATTGQTSGYGRGTTNEDRRLGNTSLGYHEKSHSRDYLSYIVNNPAPVFTGAIGDTRQEFTAAQTQYNQEVQSYFVNANRSSELATDCFGNPTIVKYHTTNGSITNVACH